MNKTKTLKIFIEQQDFPMLFKLNKNDLSEMCYNIFQSGYNSYFPQQKQRKVLKEYKSQTDSIKYDLLQLKSTIDNKDIDEKINRFTDILEELFGINMHTTKKGQIAENIIYKLIEQKFKDYSIEKTRNKPHHGDGIIHTSDNKKIMLEIKNYSKSVNNDELEKLLFDMNHTSIHYSLFISLKSTFVKQKRLSIEEYTKNNKIFTVVFIPNALTDVNLIENGLVMINKIMNYNKKNILLNINNELAELDLLYSQFSIMKNNYLCMEKDMKNNLHNYYLSLRDYEINLTNIVNNIWTKIDHKLLEPNKTTKIKHKLFKKILDVLHKHNYDIINTIDDINTNQCYPIFNISTKKSIGSLLKNKSIFELQFKNINIKINKKNTISDINNKINILDIVLLKL